MFPVLFQFGSLKIYSYGFFIALGYLAAIFVSCHFAKKENIPRRYIIDIGFFSLLLGLVGARLLFVLTMPSYFRKYPEEIVLLWQGGLVFYGGFLAALPFIFWFIKKRGLPLWRTLDILSLGLVVGHAIGRIGCLGAGCCHGKACDYPWAVKLNTDLVDPSLRDVPVHPTQAYEALALLLLFVVLYFVWRRQKQAGTVTLTYLFAYAVLRSIIEIFRGDAIRGTFLHGKISTSQILSLVVAGLAAQLLLRRRRSHSRGRSENF